MGKKVLVKLTVRNDDIYDIRRTVKDAAKDNADIEDEFDDDFAIGEEEPVSAFPSEGMEIITEGHISRKNGRIELKYVETDASDMSNEITTLSYDENEPGIITMERNGVCRTAMVFEAGKRYICVYDVSGMVLELVVRTYDLENKLTDNGGSIRLGYTLENGGATVSRVKMIIEVKALD